MAINEAASKAVVSGVRWSTAGQVLGQILRFCVSIILARLLVPEDFGLLAMATVVTGLAMIFQSLGTTGIIIQKKEISPELLASLFLINVTLGLLLAFALVLLAPLVASLYDSAEVENIIKVLALIFIISSFGLVHRGLLNRNMQFNRLAQIDLLTALVQGLTAITLAYLEFQVWALVTANIVGAFCTTVLLYLVVGWHIRFYFHLSVVREVMGFGLNLTGANFVDYILRNLDKVVIGRFLGEAALGFYSMAYSLYEMPRQSITGILSRVLFPVFSRLQDDNAAIQKGVLRTVAGVSLVTIPMMIGLAVVAEPFVMGLLGEKWRPIIPLIMIFAPTGVCLAIAAATGQVYLAKGRSDWLLRWNLAAGSLIVISVFCGLPWGIVGVATAYAIVMVPIAYLSCKIPFRLIKAPVSRLFRTLYPYVLAGVLMGVFALSCRLILESIGWESLSVLATSVAFGIFVYTTIILMWQPPAFQDMLTLLPGSLHNKLKKFRWSL